MKNSSNSPSSDIVKPPKKQADRRKKTQAWAEALSDHSKKIFLAWHHREEMTEAGFHRSMITHLDRFSEIVREQQIRHCVINRRPFSRETRPKHA